MYKLFVYTRGKFILGFRNSGTRRTRLRPLALAILLVAGGFFPLACSEAGEGAGAAAGPGAGVRVTDIGPGLLSLEINRTYLAGDTHYVLSRRVVPATLMGYDWVRGEVTLNREVFLNGDPATGGRGMAIVGDNLYIAMGVEERQAALVRVDLNTHEIEELERLFPPVRVVWDMAASPDGKLYLATSRQTNARVYEYDTERGELRDLGEFEEEPRQDARSIAATEDKLYVGIGYNAINLWSVDRRTHERESILPPEFREKEHYWLYSLDANEDWVAAGTEGPEGLLAVIDRSDYSNYRIVEYGGSTLHFIDLAGDTVYFGGGSGVWAYDIKGDTVEKVTSMPVNRGLFYRDGVLYGGAGRERIGSYDLSSGELQVVNLLDEGVETGAEPAQSLAAGGGKLYYGGRSLGVRDLESGELETVDAPGEAKSMVVVDGLLYMGMYTSGNLVSYDPATGTIETLAEAPEGQLRPRIVHYDEAHRLLLMGTQADELGGGALTVYNLETGESESWVNPLGERAIATLASGDGVIYVAAQRGGGPVGAWDPKTGEWLWETVPLENDWVMGLAERDGRLYGLGVRGTVVVMDPRTGEVGEKKRLFSWGGRLMADDEGVYGVTDEKFFRIDPATLEPEILVDELNSRWVPNWPALARDEDGAFYVVREANVLKVEVAQ